MDDLVNLQNPLPGRSFLTNDLLLQTMETQHYHVWWEAHKTLCQVKVCSFHLLQFSLCHSQAHNNTLVYLSSQISLGIIPASWEPSVLLAWNNNWHSQWLQTMLWLMFCALWVIASMCDHSNEIKPLRSICMLWCLYFREKISFQI